MASKKNLATHSSQDNPRFDRIFSELGFSAHFPFTFEGRMIDDESEEDDRVDWEDFLGYHSEVLR